MDLTGPVACREYHDDFTVTYWYNAGLLFSALLWFFSSSKHLLPVAVATDFKYASLFFTAQLKLCKE
jgi:hypothetical protein